MQRVHTLGLAGAVMMAAGSAFAAPYSQVTWDPYNSGSPTRTGYTYDTGGYTYECIQGGAKDGSNFFHMSATDPAAASTQSWGYTGKWASQWLGITGTPTSDLSQAVITFDGKASADGIKVSIALGCGADPYNTSNTTSKTFTLTSQWETYTTLSDFGNAGFNPAPGAGAFMAFFVQPSLPGTGTSSIDLDNLTYAAVPEPAALGLALVGFGMTLRRRRCD
jgi:hypothetical protein